MDGREDWHVLGITGTTFLPQGEATTGTAELYLAKECSQISIKEIMLGVPVQATTTMSLNCSHTQEHLLKNNTI